MKRNTRLKRAISWIKLHWRGIITSILIASVATFTLSLQIGTLVEGQNRFETDTLAYLEEPSGFLDNIVNAPYMLPAYAMGWVIDDPLIGARIISVLFGLLSTMLLFFILKRWYDIRIAAIGSLLLVTSAWMLAISHQAAPFIMLVFIPLLLLWALTRYVNEKDKTFSAFIGLVISLAISAYIPLMIWSILAVFAALIFIYRKRLIAINSQGILVASLLYLLILAPLAYSLFQNPEQIRILAGIPDQLPTIAQYFENFVKQFVAIFAYTDKLPELFIHTKPLLDIFLGTMVLLGIYHFYKFMPKRRSMTIFVAMTLLFLIIPLQPNYLVALTAILPFIYILIPSGIHELIRRWFVVFPRNPLARSSAAILLVVVIGLSVSYNLQKFYIAWPNTPETKSAYMIESKE